MIVFVLIRKLVLTVEQLWCFNLWIIHVLAVGDEDIASVDAATLKQAYAGLVTMILEAVKMDFDSPSVR